MVPYTVFYVCETCDMECLSHSQVFPDAWQRGYRPQAPKQCGDCWNKHWVLADYESDSTFPWESWDGGSPSDRQAICLRRFDKWESRSKHYRDPTTVVTDSLFLFATYVLRRNNLILLKG